MECRGAQAAVSVVGGKVGRPGLWLPIECKSVRLCSFHFKWLVIERQAEASMEAHGG